MVLSLFDELPEVMHLTPNRSSSLPSTYEEVVGLKQDVLIVTRQLVHFLQHGATINKTMIVFSFHSFPCRLESSANQTNLRAMM